MVALAIRLFFLIAPCLCFASPIDPAIHPPDTWPRFRGHDGDGIGSGFRFPAPWSEKAIRWKIDLPGSGHSSPVVWKDRVFVTSCDAKTAKRILSCFAATDGHVLWQKEFESQVHPMNKDNSYASSTPAVNERAVFIYWTKPDEATVAALDHDGKELWRSSLGPFKSQHGGGTSPVCVGDRVVVGNDQDGESSLIGLDVTTGKVSWKIDRKTDKAAYSTPCVRRLAGGAQELIFTSTSHGLTGVDPKSGKVNWDLADAFPMRVVGSAAVADGLVAATCGGGGIGRKLVIAKPGDGGSKGSVVYEAKALTSYVPTPIAVGGLLFLWGDKGTVVCMRARSGEKVWEQKLEGTFYCSPIFGESRLFCVSREGTLFVIAAGDKYEQIAAVPFGERSFATPAIANGTMYLRTETHLMAIGSASAKR